MTSSTISLREKIAIVLPTYNGEAYLAEQLDSLLAQSYKNFVIVTRDDGSHDESKAIISRYADEQPELFCVLPSDEENLGASAGFSLLTQYVLGNKERLGLSNAYIMFCDQDDVWLPTKVEVDLRAMLAREKLVGSNEAVLIHSDLRVVDERLNLLSDSFFTYQKIDSSKNSVWHLLLRNTVTGCTMMINEPLARVACPIPKEAVMHDWWLALVCSAVGDIVTLPEALVSYRQHGGNTLGAQQYQPRSAMRRLVNIVNDKRHEAIALDLFRQSQVFCEKHIHALRFSGRIRLRLMRSLGASNAQVRTLALKLLVAF